MKNIILIFYFTFIIFSCKGNQKESKENIKSNENDIEYLKSKPLSKKLDNNLKSIDSIYIGVEFYKLNDFKNYQFVEMEPYEEFLTDDKNNMYHIMVYKKNQVKYALLVILEKNINEGELSPLWKKTKKRVLDMIKYPEANETCWYYSYSRNEDVLNSNFYVIVDLKKLNLNAELDEKNEEIKRRKLLTVWSINYETKEFNKINNLEIVNKLLCF